MKHTSIVRFAFLLLPTLLAGCATLSNVEWEERDRVHLTRDSLKLLEGTYAYYGVARRCRTAEGILCPTGFFDALDRLSPMREAEPEDSTARLALSVRDSRHITATVYVDGAIVAEEVLDGRVNSRGYFEVDSITRLVFTPFIVVWGVNTQMAQFGVDTDGALLVQHATDGVAFLVIPFPVMGTTSGSTYVFPPVEVVPR